MMNLKSIKLSNLGFADNSRRRFLKLSAMTAGGGFMVGCSPAPAPESSDAARQGATAAAPVANPAAQHTFSPFVQVGGDGLVTVFSKHMDKGQGVSTGLPTLVAEELDADWSQMRVVFAPANAALYNNFAFGPMQGTGGSTSIANSFMQYRQAGAAAKAMLVQAAAAQWGVEAGEISVSKGTLRHAGSAQRGNFGEFAAAAASITPPAEPAVKDPADFTLIGTHVPRLDSPSKTDGTATYTIDVNRPGQLIAVLARPPKFGGVVKRFDATQAKAIPGVQHVVQIQRGVAVLADSYFTALKARKALQIEWDYDKAEKRGSKELLADFKAAASEPGMSAVSNGDAERALTEADKTLEAHFEFPFLAHASMEPLDCVVELSTNKCEIWTASQIQTLDQGVAAGITGLSPEQIVINTQYSGGSFGRRAVPDSDYVAEAVMIAKAINGTSPVKLQWSREDDMRGGRYRPMSYHVMRGGLNSDGKVTGWSHRAVVQSFLRATPFEMAIQNGIDGSSLEGTANLPYAIDNMMVELHSPIVDVPTLWWRSVGHTQNAYITEVFFDEVAHAAGRDPYELRGELLASHPRHTGVLETAAKAAGWGRDLGPGKGAGIAVHESFGSFVAQVVEVSTQTDGNFSVDRVVCAVDCGIAVNPDVVKAQMEGGIAYALSAALREEITLVDGEVQQSNFDAYQPLRMNEMPVVEVHIVPSSEAPSGVGEPGVPTLAPALANALFAATGKRIRKLPIGDQLKG